MSSLSVERCKHRLAPMIMNSVTFIYCTSLYVYEIPPAFQARLQALEEQDRVPARAGLMS